MKLLGSRSGSLTIPSRSGKVRIPESRLPSRMHIHHGVAYLIDPGSPKQLLTFPNAVAQVQVANLGHVARLQVEPPTPV